MTTNGPSPPETIARGIAAGIAGNAVMTAFQKLVEMPLTGRGDSYAPYKPMTWTKQDTVIDVSEKLIQAVSDGGHLRPVLGPALRSR